MKCNVCLTREVSRSNARTCGGECAELWPVVRRYLDDAANQSHADARARTILRDPARYPEAEVAWAQRRIQDPKRVGHRGPISGSATAHALKRVDEIRAEASAT